MSSFATLEKELRDLTDVPLTVNGVQGCSALFRYTEVFPPVACIRKPDDTNIIAGESHLKFGDNVVEIPYFLQPIEATIQLSTSGKWPDDLEAFRMTKAAFNLQIAECMRTQYKARAFGSLKKIDIMKVSINAYFVLEYCLIFSWTTLLFEKKVESVKNLHNVANFYFKDICKTNIKVYHNNNRTQRN